MSIALFYVSSHGYGHAVRAAQVMDALIERGFSITARTMAPAWLFPKGVNVEAADVDAGLVQRDCLAADLPASLQAFIKRRDQAPAGVERELGAVTRIKPGIIVCDIAPLGVRVARRVGLPCVVVANFLWDWILRAYVEHDPRFGELANELSDVYLTAGDILRTPLSGGFEPYPNTTLIPLIARAAPRSRAQARALLGLPDERPLALVSMGGVGHAGFIAGLPARVKRFDLLLTDDTSRHDGTTWTFNRAQAAHHDLLAACDVVIGKMGYGLCADLIATKRGLLYTARDDFIEFSVLEAQTLKFTGARKLPAPELFDGPLDGHLQGLLAAAHPAATAPINGAQVAADIMARRARGIGR